MAGWRIWPALYSDNQYLGRQTHFTSTSRSSSVASRPILPIDPAGRRPPDDKLLYRDGALDGHHGTWVSHTDPIYPCQRRYFSTYENLIALRRPLRYRRGVSSAQNLNRPPPLDAGPNAVISHFGIHCLAAERGWIAAHQLVATGLHRRHASSLSWSPTATTDHVVVTGVCS
eukprot:SAG11_NODE_11108_length_783_cov_1.026316_2_plen_172_part_01